MKKKMTKINPEDFFIYQGGEEQVGEDEIAEQSMETVKQNLRVRKEKKGRGGKVVSVIEGFKGSESQMENLTKTIKQHCGTGGSIKEDQIIIQGDIADKIVKFLQSKGFQAKKTTL